MDAFHMLFQEDYPKTRETSRTSSAEQGRELYGFFSGRSGIFHPKAVRAGISRDHIGSLARGMTQSLEKTSILPNKI